MNSTVTFFQNAFDNAVTDDCALELDWSELQETLRTWLVISDEKNGLGFVWARYNTTNPVDLVPTSNTDPTPKLDRFGRPMARRTASNVIEYFGLCLDYDGDARLQDVREQLAGLRHLGYTSFNHVVKGVDKFRILIPFTHPCPLSAFRLRVQGFKDLFPGTDKQTFDSSRIFYAPNVSAANRQHYQYWSAEGEALDWSLVPETPEYQAPAPDPAVALLKQQGFQFAKHGTGKVDWDSFDIVQFAHDAGMDPKPAGPNKYNVICPRAHEHSHGVTSGTVIYDDFRDGHFYCSHSHGSSWFFQHWADHFQTKRWKESWCNRLVTEEKK